MHIEFIFCCFPDCTRETAGTKQTVWDYVMEENNSQQDPKGMELSEWVSEWVGGWVRIYECFLRLVLRVLSHTYVLPTPVLQCIIH